MAETTDVVVIGAGPAGLAVGACLRKAGVDFIILEKERQIAPSWRRHYERLHLHTVKQLSSLPFMPFPASYPRYVPRNSVIEYLDGYAAKFDLRPRLGDAARSVRREGSGWTVESTASSIRARYVVIASGFNAEPVTPSIPGMDKFKGRTLHSSSYVNAKSFAGQSVLVVGMGNSGAEIALDLVESGARAAISLRNGVHIVPRDLFGIPIQIVAMLATKVLPLRANDAIFPVILDLALGNLAKHGVRRPEQGLLSQVVNAAKIPVLDVGTARKISQGAIRVVPGLSAMTEDGVVFNTGEKARFDAIIYATGYRPNFRSFLEADDIKTPADAAPGKPNSTLFFVGFKNPVTGLLREAANEAVAVARTIARQRESGGAARA